MHDYNPSEVEAKWQKKWAEAHVFDVEIDDLKDPYYLMVMFPYPSGARLHVGHWFQYSIPDSFGRFQKMRGKEVFHPLGFDAFGLPAENYAIKTGTPPAESTKENVETMIEQYKRMGVMFDWRYMLNTSTPEYYRWTQWLFLQMHKHGLAERRLGNVNWCPKDQTVLANEQVHDGKCERCGTDVVQKNLEQWFWKITKYAQPLLEGLEKLDWPEKTKTMQRNWIDRSEGVNFTMKVKDMPIEFEVYDSIPQTYKAQTFVVIAPEHPLVEKLVHGTDHQRSVMDFVDRIKKKKAAKRFDFAEDMEGIETGRFVKNPFGTGDLPIWVASFVVMEYGTGIVSCSAHDERDFAFAKQYGLPLNPVMFPADKKEAEKVKNLEYCYTKDPEGILQQPEEFKGRKWGEAREDIIDYIVEQGIGTRQINYRLRDWLVSRQRYWGSPIPIVYDPQGVAHPIPEKHLPWLLPTDVEFKPTGESPLKQSKEFKERTEKIFGKGWTPEYDTMDTFVCSSFYQLRYLMRGDDKHFVDPHREKKFFPVDMYIGGPEHACMHLIYVRFVMKALKDFGVVSHDEPFQRLVHQGLITNQGAKMSKSKGNVVSPDELVAKHGSDVFRMYLMFMGPFTEGGDWSDTGIKGIDRFVGRLVKVYDAYVAKRGSKTEPKIRKEQTVKLHQTIKKVTEEVEALRFNTAIAALMELLNEIEQSETMYDETAVTLALMLGPVAPHLAEELWEKIEGKGFVADQKWPHFEASLLKSDSMVIAVQINGKLRGDITVAADASKEDILAAAKEHENVKKYLEAGIKKEIYVPGKLVSLVV
jgi:leucyl-tRNA synthetase